MCERYDEQPTTSSRLSPIPSFMGLGDSWSFSDEEEVVEEEPEVPVGSKTLGPLTAAVSPTPHHEQLQLSALRNDLDTRLSISFMKGRLENRLKDPDVANNSWSSSSVHQDTKPLLHTHGLRRVSSLTSVDPESRSRKCYMSPSPRRANRGNVSPYQLALRSSIDRGRNRLKTKTRLDSPHPFRPSRPTLLRRHSYNLALNLEITIAPLAEEEDSHIDASYLAFNPHEAQLLEAGPCVTTDNAEDLPIEMDTTDADDVSGGLDAAIAPDIHASGDDVAGDKLDSAAELDAAAIICDAPAIDVDVAGNVSGISINAGANIYAAAEESPLVALQRKLLPDDRRYHFSEPKRYGNGWRTSQPSKVMKPASLQRLQHFQHVKNCGPALGAAPVVPLTHFDPLLAERKSIDRHLQVLSHSSGSNQRHCLPVPCQEVIPHGAREDKVRCVLTYDDLPTDKAASTNKVSAEQDFLPLVASPDEKIGAASAATSSTAATSFAADTVGNVSDTAGVGGYPAGGKSSPSTEGAGREFSPSTYGAGGEFSPFNGGADDLVVTAADNRSKEPIGAAAAAQDVGAKSSPAEEEEEEDEKDEEESLFGSAKGGCFFPPDADDPSWSLSKEEAARIFRSLPMSVYAAVLPADNYTPTLKQPRFKSRFKFVKTGEHSFNDKHAIRRHRKAPGSLSIHNTPETEALKYLELDLREDRCIYYDKEEIESSMDNMDQTHCLPNHPGRKEGTLAITIDTMNDLLKGDFDEAVESVIIVDCRYPYEFTGGHIKGAVNWYEPQRCKRELFETSCRPTIHDPNKRIVLIFHCEFSSERAPKMYQEIREFDRCENRKNYPFLFYPEMYVLEGGYKKFFAEYSNDWCDGGYLEMNDKAYLGELKRYRSSLQKTKSFSYKTMH